MVAIAGIGEVGAGVLAYCLLKCGGEYGDRRRRGKTGPRSDERRKFIACYTSCISPVDLPDRSDDDDDDD